MSRLRNTILMLSITAAVLLSITSGHTAPVDHEGARVESLRTVLPLLGGEARLKALWDIAEADRDSKAGKEVEEQSINRFLKEARLQKNRDMEAKALQMLQFYYYNYDDRERYFALSEAAAEFYLDNGYMDYYWEYHLTEIAMLLHSNRQDEALNLTRDMYSRAKSQNDIYGLAIAAYFMGKNYGMADKVDAAIESYLEAWSYIKQLKDPVKRTRLMYLCASSLVIEFNNTQQYDRSLAILDEWSRNAEEGREWALKNNESANTSDVSRIYCDIFRAETYMLTGNFGEAEKYLARVEAVVDNYPPNTKNHYLFTKRIIHKAKGEYEEALEVDIRLSEYFAAIGDMAIYNTTMSDMRESLKALGRYREAVELGDKILRLSDSLNNTEHLKQLNELKTIYEVDKLEAQKQRQTIVITAIGAGCFLLALIITIYIIYSLSLKRKTVSLYNQIQEMKRAEKEAERILELIPEAELSREMKLFRELTSLMHSEKLFLDPAVDRRQVASRLGTNEKYLANAIHEGAPDTTFANYISGLRLAYSLDLLTGSPDMTLETVAEESGHGSYSTFFRAFGRKYGMSPSEYRKLFSAKSH